MKKIAVYQRRYLGISEAFIYRQLHGLSDEFEVNIYSDKIENLDIYPEYKPQLLPEYTRKLKRWEQILHTRRRYMQKRLRHCDLLHVNYGPDAIPSQEWANAASIPITCYFHGYDASRMLRNPKYINSLKNAKFARIFVCSQEVQKRISPYINRETRVSVVYLGIPLDQFKFQERNKVSKDALFLQISRLAPKKGLDITLKTFSRYIKENNPSARLLIAGEGPLRNELEHLVELLGIREKVKFMGPISHKEVPSLLNNADVFLHHSVTAPDGDMEGLPITIMEAMACGLPVISAYHSGIPELIQHGVNGFLVKEGDVEGYLKQMIGLQEENISKISRNARTQIEMNFDLDNSNRRLCSYIKEVMG